MLVTVSDALPLLVSVSDCGELDVPTAGLPKLRLEGETVAFAAVPVPERLTDWGLPVALSAMARDAARLPLADAVKMTLMTQFPPAATLEPQVLVCVKSLALAPETEMLVTFKVAPPVFVRVTD